MHLLNNGKVFKQWEGLRLNAYKDAIGVWTIGYGHTNSAGKPFIYEGMTITEKQAEELLCQDLRQFENVVERAVTVSLTDEQFAALVSFCYNVGTGAFCNSTLLKSSIKVNMKLSLPSYRNGPKREANVYKVLYTGV